MTSPPDCKICLPTGVFAVDREGKINFWNAGAERITGYLKQEVLGRVYSDGFLEHPEGRIILSPGTRRPCWRR
jgi:PAS domain S-box-containing protein